MTAFWHTCRNVALVLCVACAVTAGLLLPSRAYAEAGVFTAQVSAYYANPDTGIIEDSGGESSAELGTSMVSGIVQSEALIEEDASGAVLATVRLGLAESIGDVYVAASTDASQSYTNEVVAEKVQTLSSDNMADYRFSIPSTSVTLRFRMYVQPMGRDVVFFIQFSNLTEGNTAGFIETADITQEVQSQQVVPESEDSAPTADNTSSDDASAQGTAIKGAREFDAEGNEVTGGVLHTGAADLNYPLILIVAGVLTLLVVLITYMVYYRPIRKLQSKAERAARDGWSLRDISG